MSELPDPDDIDALDSELVKQFPKPIPPPPNLEMSDVPDDIYYPDGPPAVTTIPLLKSKYENRIAALIRARELCTLRGLRFVRMFEQVNAYVVHAHKGAP